MLSCSQSSGIHCCHASYDEDISIFSMRSGFPMNSSVTLHDQNGGDEVAKHIWCNGFFLFCCVEVMLWPLNVSVRSCMPCLSLLVVCHYSWLVKSRPVVMYLQVWQGSKNQDTLLPVSRWTEVTWVERPWGRPWEHLLHSKMLFME